VPACSLVQNTPGGYKPMSFGGKNMKRRKRKKGKVKKKVKRLKIKR
jgi:hypothetical protein